MYNNAPTPKQIKYANDIYKRTGITLPTQETFSAYREYIALNKRRTRCTAGVNKPQHWRGKDHTVCQNYARKLWRLPILSVERIH